MSVVFTETGERITLAAGAVLMRGVGNKREIALVHRPAYNDWSLPKGKPNKGELAPATAVREVEEETGIRIRLGPALQDGRYRIPRGPKVVRFWVGHELRSSERKPDQEIDDVVWLKVTAARKRMTYADERLVLDQAVALPETTPFLLVRHTRATPRARWRGDDRLRPLDQTGRKQALRLIPLLDEFVVRTLPSNAGSLRAVHRPAGEARVTAVGRGRRRSSRRRGALRAEAGRQGGALQGARCGLRAPSRAARDARRASDPGPADARRSGARRACRRCGSRGQPRMARSAQVGAALPLVTGGRVSASPSGCPARSQRSTRAEPPPASFLTSLRVAIEVSPGVVIAMAPCAAP